MLVTTERTLKVQCSHCGNTQTHKFSLFAVHGQPLQFSCQCGVQLIELFWKERALWMQMPCSECQHMYLMLISLEEYVKTDSAALYCPSCGGPLAHLTASDISSEQQGSTVNDSEPIIVSRYFAHPDVMRKVLEILQTIAAAGQLTCECGNKHLDFDVYHDRVEIMCDRCGSLLVVYAETEEDLKSLVSLRQISLLKGSFGYIDAAHFFGHSHSKHTPEE